MLGCRVLNPDRSDQRGSRRTLLTPYTALVETFRLDRLAPRLLRRYRLNHHDNPVPADTTCIPVISGACMMLPAATFHAVGGMDEGYFLHVDDLDLCFRLHRAGIPVYFTPHVEAVHHAGSSRRSPVLVEWHKMRGFLRYFLAHFHSLRWWLLLGPLGAGILIRFGVKAMQSLLHPGVEVDHPERMTPGTDIGMSEKQFAVILGATSLVGRYLAQRLADSGFEGLCLSRHIEPIPYQMPPGFSWNAVSEAEKLRIPVSATLFSLAPVSALPFLLAHITGGNRLIALSSSSLLFGEQSSNPDERYSALALGRAEERVLALCRQRGIAWTIFRPTLIYDPGFDRNISRIAAFVHRFRFFPVVRPGTGQRQPIHADDVAQAMVAASSSLPRPEHAV